MGFISRIVARRFGVPVVVNIQDLFPQCAIDLGMLHSRLLIRFMEAIEGNVYRRSDMITVMSDGNRDFVIEKGGRPDRVLTVFNWVDTDEIRPGKRLNEFRRVHELGDKFIVLFAGTMGWSQGLDGVVDAAQLLAGDPEILFLFVGDGVEKDRTIERSRGLPNVRFLPMQSKETYPQVLAACDAGLVTLRPEVLTPTVPSKINTILAAARPLIACLPPGDAPQLILDAQAGLVVPPADGRAWPTPLCP